MTNVNRLSHAVVGFLCGTGLLLLAGAGTEAKLLNIALAELIDRSDFIAYGETVEGARTPTAVLFRPKTILKGKAPRGEGIVLCNDPAEVESRDLRRMQTAYVVFASKKWRCYKPVHGISSIVEVEDGTALTVAIVDQPMGQPFDEFMKKIQSHLE